MTKYVRLKPFLITRRKVSRAVRKALRDKTKEELIKYAKNKTSYEIFDDILSNSLPKDLSIKVKKVYPLSLCEIRVIRVENFKEGYPIVKGFESPKKDKKDDGTELDKKIEKDVKTASIPKAEKESSVKKEKDLKKPEEGAEDVSDEEVPEDLKEVESDKAEKSNTTKKKSSKKTTKKSTKKKEEKKSSEE